jgi:hypothetical protein
MLLQLQARSAWCTGLGHLRNRVYINIFRVITPYSSVQFHRRFCLLIDFFLGVLFDSEDGGDTIPRNVAGVLPNYSAFRPKGSYSS